MTITEIVAKMVEARKAYYEGRAIMSDSEYDALEETLRQTDSDHPLLAAVGHLPSSPWMKASHHIPMGSLQKVNSNQEFLKWAARVPTSTRFVQQWKLDGFSISLEYEDSHFVRGVTRGDGMEGEDISDNVRLMQGFRNTLAIGGFHGAVRAEVLLPKEAFAAINSTLPDEDQYENPRSAAAGISRRLDGMYSKYLVIRAYDVADHEETYHEDEKSGVLNRLGFPTPPQIVGSHTDMVTAFEDLRKNRNLLEVNIDGAVVKICDSELRDSMGFVSGRPKSQIAWKFDPPGAVTTFLRETWDVGRTGVVTPLGYLDPIRIDGSTISRATLHNVAEIKRLGIGRGDLVMLTKRGDIIPKIEEVIEHKGTPLVIPENCPACQTPLLNDGVKLICPNEPGCQGRAFYRILNWIKVVKVDGFGESLAAALRDTGKLSSIMDLYRLTEADISTLEGWGETTAKKIMEGLSKTYNLPSDVFLSALGIPSISTRTSEELIKAFGSLQGVLDAKMPAIEALKGFSEISAAKIVFGLARHREEILALIEKIKPGTSLEPSGGKLAGSTFCFTGAMSKPRSYFQGIVTKHGGRNLSTVTKDLNYLVCNEDKGSSKSQKAAKFGTKLINEAEFLAMAGDKEEEKPVKAAVVLPSLFDDEPQ